MKNWWYLFLLILCFDKADAALSERAPVKKFIATLVKNYRFNEAELTSILNAAEMKPQILTIMQKPFEALPWRNYQILFVSKTRIENGVKFWQKYEAALARAEKIYGVPASIIVATIGIETKYGEKPGDYRVLDALVTLAFDYPPRENFFKKELTEFLLLCRERKLNPFLLKGSYAGAIGQPQFMPSSYREYAVNFSGNNETNLMSNTVDVIGSVANYYHKNGWINHAPIAIEASLMSKSYYYFQKLNLAHEVTLPEIAKLGIFPKQRAQTLAGKVKLIQLKNRFDSEYWLGFHNFDVIKRYNNSNLYAMAVYQLSVNLSKKKESTHDA